jgi:hypothetical protein
LCQALPQPRQDAGEKKVLLDGREQFLILHEAALVEAQSRGLNPQDNYQELMVLVELWRCLEEAKVEHFTEVEWLAVLLGDISKVLVDLGMPRFPGIPRDSCTADNILEVVGTILECLREAYTSNHGPWD